MDASAFYAAMNNQDAASLYAATTVAGMFTTAALAPLVGGPTKEVAPVDELCELVNAPLPSEMHQPYFTEEFELAEDWWVCAGQTALAENCREVFHDGEVQVACAF